jgi:hypothetical protein
MTTHTHTPTYYLIRSIVRLAFVTGVAVVSFLVGKTLASEPYPYQCNGTTVTAVAGDTLWSLAKAHCEGHTGAIVSDLYKEHGDLQVGEVISFARKRG